MSARCNARRLAPGLLLALGIAACMSAPQKPEAPADTPAADPQAAAQAPAPPVNPYPGMTRRTAPDGSTLYCRKEVATGERIAKERCFTEYAMRQLEAQRGDFERSRENSVYGTTGGPR
ncbi:MAG TPA: hypothetical protein VD701_01945 [Steroidobacteraceae bacterium]|nr:hypothetical protein [Steroidobacteraceae bacterium]